MRFITPVLLLACIALAAGCKKKKDTTPKKTGCGVSADSLSFTATGTDTILVKARQTCKNNKTVYNEVIQAGALPPGCTVTSQQLTNPVRETYLYLQTGNTPAGSYKVHIICSEAGYEDDSTFITLVVK